MLHSIFHLKEILKKRLQIRTKGTQTNPSTSNEASSRKEKKFVIVNVAFVLALASAFAFCWRFTVPAYMEFFASPSKLEKFKLIRYGFYEKQFFIPAAINTLINPVFYFIFAYYIGD